MTFRRRLPAFLALNIVCIALDQFVKRLAANRLRGEAPIEHFGGSVRIEYAENTGAFLGMGDSLPESARIAIFLVATGAMLVGVTWYVLRHPDVSRTDFVALSLIVAGGIGNLIDRALAGFVIDFVSVGIGPVRTGIFNIADVAITGAALWLLVEGLFRREPEPRGETAAAVAESEPREGA